MARDPETGVRAKGIHRLQVLDAHHLGINAPAERRLSRAFLRAEEAGQALPVAIAVGAGPFVDLASQAKASHRVDKMGIAGALAGEPVPLAPACTQPVEVPAEAQLVLEGRLLPNRRAWEGPFGEVTGTYGEADLRPVIEVTAVTRRRDAVYQTVLTGLPNTENHAMGWPAIAEAIWRFAEQATPEVTDVHVAGPNYVAIVAIKKRMAGEARNVISAVLGPASGSPGPKYCIVVDDDIDVRDWGAVGWALSTRVQPDRDVLIFPSLVGAPLDPSAPERRHSSKLGIDATKPLAAAGQRFRPVEVPGMDRVRW